MNEEGNIMDLFWKIGVKLYKISGGGYTVLQGFLRLSVCPCAPMPFPHRQR